MEIREVKIDEIYSSSEDNLLRTNLELCKALVNIDLKENEEIIIRKKKLTDNEIYEILENKYRLSNGLYRNVYGGKSPFEDKYKLRDIARTFCFKYEIIKNTQNNPICEVIFKGEE